MEYRDLLLKTVAIHQVISRLWPSSRCGHYPLYMGCETASTFLPKTWSKCQCDRLIKFFQCGVTCKFVTRRSQHPQECKDPRWPCICDSRPWHLTFWPQNKLIFRAHRGHLCARFGNRCIMFEISCGKTDRHRQIEPKPHPATTICVSIK